MRFCSSAFLVLFLSIAVFGQQKPKSLAEVSMQAPAFEATALSGKTYKLADLKGKVIVMNFWSVNCPFCAAETPDLNALVDSYKGKDVVFLGFAVNTKTKVEQFLKKKPFKYEIIPSSMDTMLLSYGNKQSDGTYNLPFPLHVLINKDGIIEINETGIKGAKTIKEKLAKIFAAETKTGKKAK